MEKKKTVKKTSTKTTKKTPVKKTTKKKKTKGFTLIELLAVIIILGVLMIVAIPSVTTYISESRKSSYATTAQNIVSGARTLVNSGKLQMYDQDVTYYLPYDLISTENKASTPYGEFDDAYVVVTYNGDGYDYYFTSKDTAKMGVYLTAYNDLKSDRVISDVDSIFTDVSICGKDHIIIFDKNGNIANDNYAYECIEENSSYDIEDEKTDNCNYVIKTQIGSFNRATNSKELCLNDLHYENYGFTIAYGIWGYRAPGTILEMYFMDLYRFKMKDSSYVKVYSDSTKQNLIYELDKSKLPYAYSLNNDGYTTLFRAQIGDYDGNEVYVDFSDDLKNIEYGFSYVKPSDLHTMYINGYWTSNPTVLNKMYNLGNDLYNQGYEYRGLTKCNIYEQGKENECDDHTYYIVTEYVGIPNDQPDEDNPTPPIDNWDGSIE